MPKIGASMADIKTTFDPLPEGEYPATIKAVEQKKSRTGKDMIVITYELTADAGDNKGRQLFDNITLQKDNGERNEAGLRGFKRIVENLLGEERASDDDFDTDELLSVPCVLFVKQESYEDAGETKISNRVKKVLAA
jgi:hypothetical protein